MNVTTKCSFASLHHDELPTEKKQITIDRGLRRIHDFTLQITINLFRFKTGLQQTLTQCMSGSSVKNLKLNYEKNLFNLY